MIPDFHLSELKFLAIPRIFHPSRWHYVIVVSFSFCIRFFLAGDWRASCRVSGVWIWNFPFKDWGLLRGPGGCQLLFLQGVQLTPHLQRDEPLSHSQQWQLRARSRTTQRENQRDRTRRFCLAQLPRRPRKTEVQTGSPEREPQQGQGCWHFKYHRKRGVMGKPPSST